MTSEATTATIDRETWKVLEALHKEIRMPKKHLIRLAVKHLAECKEAKRGLTLVGYDAEAIVEAIRSSPKFYEDLPVA